MCLKFIYGIRTFLYHISHIHNHFDVFLNKLHIKNIVVGG